jgi:4-hydroxy-tetrahydrodipicolinate reductase
LDAPSGTAITLAEGIIGEIPRIGEWELVQTSDARAKNFSPLPIHAIRRDQTPGTHQVRYSSEIDDIEIIHTAHSRKGFALGAVMAAEYIHDKKGVFSMKDLLDI